MIEIVVKNSDGIATARPTIVVISASAIPGATTGKLADP